MAEGQIHKFSKYEHDDKIIIAELDKLVLGGSDALQFAGKLHELIPQGIKHLAVDLRNVEMINSSGLGMLVSGISSLRKHNISFVLCNVPAKVMSLLEMTHLNTVFKIFGNLEEAIANFE